MDKKNQNKRRAAIALVVFVALMAAATALLWPYARQLANPAVQAAFREKIAAWGFWGVLAMLGIQMLQIVIAFIPGEPVEILAGILYGGVWGAVLCLVGCVAASSLVFVLVRRFGTPLLQRFFGKKQLAEYGFLQDTRRLQTVVFLLFLIPGTPKDMLTYLAGASRIRLGSFLMLSTLARIPSVVSSTILGDSMSRGNWGLALGMFLATAALGLLGIWRKDRWVAAARRMGHKHKQ